MIALYLEAFSESDLNEIIKFYKTPVGQKAIKKLPQLATKATEIGMEMGKNVAAGFDNKIEVAYQRLDPKEVSAECRRFFAKNDPNDSRWADPNPKN